MLLETLAPLHNSPSFKAWFGESKVVDKNGEPLRVFHGTADEFSEFKHDQANKKDFGWLGKGFYFTNNTYAASHYAKEKAGSSPHIMPVFLRIETPYMATIKEKQHLTKYGNPIEAEKLVARLLEAGYDGVILDYGLADGATEYVVFNSNQIKSALGNKGAYSRDHNDITESLT